MTLDVGSISPSIRSSRIPLDVPVPCYLVLSLDCNGLGTAYTNLFYRLFTDTFSLLMLLQQLMYSRVLAVHTSHLTIYTILYLIYRLEH